MMFVALSIGMASTVPPDHKDAEGPVKAADEALYYAKAADRNSVVFRRDGEYVTYNTEDIDLGATGVLRILASEHTS